MEKKIKDLFKIKKGKKEKQLEIKDDNTVRYIQIEDLRNDDNIKYCRIRDKSTLVYPDDIVIAWDGANAGTIAYGLKGIIGSTLARLKPNKSNFVTNYIGRYLESKSKYIRDNCIGATVPHVDRKVLQNITVNLPPLQTQKKIVKVLDKAQELIDLRKKQIELLDELIQSIFYGMFGDPVANPKGWEITNIKDVSSKVSSGSTPRGGQSVYSDKGYYFIRSQNVLFNSLKLEDISFIDEEIHNNMKRTWLKNGDVLLNITGASIGRVATYNLGNNKGNVNQHVCIIRPIDKINSIFLCRQMSLKNYQRRILNKNAGGTREAFNYTQIKNFKVILPPIKLQNEFAQKVQKIEAQKQLMQESLTEMQNNFNSLMQKAFKGELFN